MEDITANTVKAMTSAQLAESLLQQEKMLREHAVTNGFDSSASREEFMAWANTTPYAGNIEALLAEMKHRPSSSRKLLASKAAWLIAFFGLILLVNWLRPFG